MTKFIAVFVKDLRSETRGKEVAPAMAVFALSLVFLMSFALPAGAGRAPVPPPLAGAVAARDIAGTFLWIALLFAGITGFGRAAAAEREGSRIEGLLLAPVDPAVLFAGKAAANFAFLTLVEVVVLPVFLLLLDVSPAALFPGMLIVTLGANIGLAAVGTLFGAASQHARSRALILPLLSFPVMLPVVLAAARLTSTLMITGAFGGEARWLALMLTYDVIFVSIAAVTYEFVIED